MILIAATAAWFLVVLFVVVLCRMAADADASERRARWGRAGGASRPRSVRVLDTVASEEYPSETTERDAPSTVPDA